MPPPTTSNQIDVFNAVADALKPQVETTWKGLFSIAHDPFEVTELLAEAPGMFRVILGWNGEDTVGDYRSGIVAQALRVVISHNRGLPFLTGANLSVAPVGGRVPLMQRVCDVRDFLRGLTIEPVANSTSKQLQYLKCEPIRVDAEGKTYQLDAYDTTWRIIARLPVLG